MRNEFEERTLDYIKNKDIKYRKRLGQYFTPRSIREELLFNLPKGWRSPRILDPACGTGEFLISARMRYPNAYLEGWEIDPELVAIAKDLVPTAQIIQKDSLEERRQGLYDLVIGNPPYFEFSPDRATKAKFGLLLNGRPNIFSLFLKLGLDLVKDGGFLAFVVPPSMNNGAYFAKVRDYIIQRSNIEFMKILADTSLFHGALQMTMLLILKKGKNKGNHIFQKENIKIFSEDPEFLRKSFENTVSLKDLGFSVKTGRLVWNQHKEKLTNNPVGALPLLWAHNITASGLEFPITGKKPQYVRVATYDEGPAIIINRITGAAQNAKLKAAKIPAGMKFIAENHCNVVFPPIEKKRPVGLFDSPSIERRMSLNTIYEQIRSIEKLQVMRRITGNTQISKTELENLFPISL